MRCEVLTPGCFLGIPLQDRSPRFAVHAAKIDTKSYGFASKQKSMSYMHVGLSDIRYTGKDVHGFGTTEARVLLNVLEFSTSFCRSSQSHHLQC